MKTFSITKFMYITLSTCLLHLSSGSGVVWADGTEGLGTPSIVISDGTGIVAAGTGMINQPGEISIVIPDGATVVQVLAYWQGFMSADVPGDPTISISNDGSTFSSVTGILVGGPTPFFSGAVASTFRADITGLGLVGSGNNTLSLKDMNYTDANNGAGVMVIYDDGSTASAIDLRDGSDLAFRDFSSPLDTTVRQTFTFPAAGNDRTGIIAMFFSSVAGSISGGVQRPSEIEVKVDGQPPFFVTDILDSVDGEEWDTLNVSVDIPADATNIEVQAFSRDSKGTGDLPASFDWNAAVLSFEPEVSSELPGRMTGGGSVFRVDNVRVTRGFQIHCDLRDPNNLQVNWAGGNKFHLTQLTGAICTEDPAINQLPRSAPFDTFNGQGVGRLNGVDGATIEFIFVDAGEPGRDDTASIKIFDPDGVLVNEVSGFLKKGNIQAHKDNKSTL